MKKIRLHKGLSHEAIADIAEQTRVSGGAPQIGDKMPDGTIYAGISPDSSGPMYAMAADGPRVKFEEAQSYASHLDSQGHQDWRLPSKAELQVLFDNRAAIGGFSPHFNPSTYWSSTPYDQTAAWCQRFADGYISASVKFNQLFVRCVR